MLPRLPFSWPFVGLVILSLSCRASHDLATGEGSSPPASNESGARGPNAAPDASPVLPPLGGVWLEAIEDDLGVVAIPLGATAKRPVVVSLHGAGGAAEWACGDWMAPTEGYPFIVCPRTRTERKGRYSSWGSVEEASARSREALAWVRSRYADWMAEGDPVYVGFSQGAEMAVLAADTRSIAWSALFVHEGGYRHAKTSLARLLAGPNAVFATCSTWGCGTSLLGKKGPHARTVDYGPHGHSTGPVALRLRADFADMVEDREEWAGLPELVRRGARDGGSGPER